VSELDEEELTDIDEVLPSLRSRIEFSRGCYLKMISDEVAEKRDYFDNYFRHHLIERLMKKKSAEPGRASDKKNGAVGRKRKAG
jgi:hypothetical protein